MVLSPDVDDDFDDFMARVEAVGKTIGDLKEGKVSPKEVDEREQAIIRKKEEHERKKRELELNRIKAREQAIADQHRQKWGFFGKWCPRCRKEQPADSEKCQFCQGPTQNEEERKAALLDKVEDYKESKRVKAEARDRWKRWLSTQKYRRVGSNLTDYSKWDVFEPSDDEEEELPPPPPPDTPEFKMLEKDMDERTKLRVERKKECEALREQGNAAFKVKNFKKAVQFYTEALEKDKATKTLYTNRALAYIHLEKFEDAEADCSRVLDIAEFLDNNKGPGVLQVRVKALMRRAAARRKLQAFEAALEDITLALTLDPKNKELSKMLAECTEDQRQYKLACDVTKAADSSPDEPRPSPHPAKQDVKPEIEAPAEAPKAAPKAAAESKPEPPKPKKSSPTPSKAADGPRRVTIEELSDSDTDDRAPAPAPKQTPSPAPKPAAPSPQSAAPKAATPSAAGFEGDATLRELGGLLQQLTKLRGETMTLTDAKDIEAKGVTCREVLCKIVVLQATEPQRVLFRERGGATSCMELLMWSACPPSVAIAAASVLAAACDIGHTAAVVMSYRAGSALRRVCALAAVVGDEAGGEVAGVQVGEELALASSELLEVLVQHEATRREVAKSEALGLIVAALAHTPPPSPSRVESLLTAFTNCAYENEGKIYLRKATPPPLTSVLNLLSSVHPGVRERASKAVMNMVSDPEIRSRCSSASAVEGTCSKLVQCAAAEPRLSTTLANVLGALMNLSLEAPVTASLTSNPVCLATLARCFSLSLEASKTLTGAGLEVALDVASRAAGVSGRCCGKVKPACTKLRELGAVVSLVHLSHPPSKSAAAGSAEARWNVADHAVRALAVLLANDSEAVSAVRTAKGGLAALVALVGHGEASDSIVGNAALCLLECCKDDAALPPLGALGAVPVLLGVARNRRGAVQHNAAIALAKMSRHPPNLQILRDNHGMEILSAHLRPK